MLKGDRASKIIDSIRAVFKRGPQIIEPLDVNGVIRDVLLLLDGDLHSHNIVLQTRLSDALPHILADPIQLQQVISNIIKNAIEAMAAVKDGPRELCLQSELAAPGNLLITVQDTGPGIAPENLERIFDRFFTTKSKGMGMGLSICRSIIEALGGRLWAESESGSAFRISLPTAASSSEAVAYMPHHRQDI